MPDDAGGSINTRKHNKILKMFGLGDIEQVSRADIIHLIVDANKHGIIEDSTKNAIENIFRFDTLSVGEIMTHRKDMVAAEDTDSLKNVAELAVSTGYSRIPV